MVSYLIRIMDLVTLLDLLRFLLANFKIARHTPGHSSSVHEKATDTASHHCAQVTLDLVPH